MNDHNNRIKKQLLDAAKNRETEAENIEIDEMERKVEPLAIMIAICMVALLANSSLEAYAAYKYKSQIDAASVFASCLNGYKIQMENIEVGCNLQKIDLAKGLK